MRLNFRYSWAIRTMQKQAWNIFLKTSLQGLSNCFPHTGIVTFAPRSRFTAVKVSESESLTLLLIKLADIHSKQLSRDLGKILLSKQCQKKKYLIYTLSLTRDIFISGDTIHFLYNEQKLEHSRL